MDRARERMKKKIHNKLVCLFEKTNESDGNFNLCVLFEKFYKSYIANKQQQNTIMLFVQELPCVYYYYTFVENTKLL